MFTGSSSSSTTTIGAWVTPPIVLAWASSGKASSEIEPLNRNSARNTSGTGERTFRNERTGSAAAQSAATALPIASESTISTTSGASKAFFSAWAAIRATKMAMNSVCARAAARSREPDQQLHAEQRAGAGPPAAPRTR